MGTMRRTACLGLLLALAPSVRAYTIYSIDAAELHRHQMHAMRAMLLDSCERSAVDFGVWIGDPGGEGDVFAAGVGGRWHRSRESGPGYGIAFETHSSTVGAWLLQLHLSHRLFESENAEVVASVAAGYQDLGGDYGLACENEFGGYSELPVDQLDYLMAGLALHGERRIGWVRFGFDLLLTHARPRMEIGEGLGPSSGSCDAEGGRNQTQLRPGGGIAVGDDQLEAYAGILPEQIVVRIRYGL